MAKVEAVGGPWSTWVPAHEGHTLRPAGPARSGRGASPIGKREGLVSISVGVGEGDEVTWVSVASSRRRPGRSRAEEDAEVYVEGRAPPYHEHLGGQERPQLAQESARGEQAQGVVDRGQADARWGALAPSPGRLRELRLQVCSIDPRLLLRAGRAA